MLHPPGNFPEQLPGGAWKACSSSVLCWSIGARTRKRFWDGSVPSAATLAPPASSSPAASRPPPTRPLCPAIHPVGCPRRSCSCSHPNSPRTRLNSERIHASFPLRPVPRHPLASSSAEPRAGRFAPPPVYPQCRHGLVHRRSSDAEPDPPAREPRPPAREALVRSAARSSRRAAGRRSPQSCPSSNPSNRVQTCEALARPVLERRRPSVVPILAIPQSTQSCSDI